MHFVVKRVKRALERLDLKCSWVDYSPKFSECQAWYFFPGFFAIFMADTSLKHIYHEVGHVFLWSRVGKTISKAEFYRVFPKNNWWTRLQGKRARGGFITEYAATSHHEDFAEVFSAVCMELFEGRKRPKMSKEVGKKYNAVKKWIQR